MEDLCEKATGTFVPVALKKYIRTIETKDQNICLLSMILADIF
jgi:hypothetical protein